MEGLQSPTAEELTKTPGLSSLGQPFIAAYTASFVIAHCNSVIPSVVLQSWAMAYFNLHLQDCKVMNISLSESSPPSLAFLAILISLFLA